MDTLVIADDITGANDIGSMYKKEGIPSIVYSENSKNSSFSDDFLVLIKDTNSRFDNYKAAYTKVYNAVLEYSKYKPRQYYNKQCSVFRGNIGAEFDAMLDALGYEFAVVVLGFPDNNRTTINGIHYVNNVMLSKTQFRFDPVHPMTESNLVTILRSQTKRIVKGLSYIEYDKKDISLKEKIAKAKKHCNYLILDVRENRDLIEIAKACYDEKIVCGSSSLARYLARLTKNNIKTINEVELITHKNKRILAVAGSLTKQTYNQIKYMKSKGTTTIELNTKLLFNNTSKSKEMYRIIELANNYYSNNKNTFLLIHTMNEKKQIERTKQIGKEKGLDDKEISLIVSKTIAEISNSIISTYDIRNLIFCGGDTSASLCSILSIDEMQIGIEIEPGLPICQGLTKPNYTLVLKSGSFGSDEFIEKAIKHITS